MPMMRHPAMFVRNVARGNPVLTGCTANDRRYLSIPPAQLPNPTNSMDFSMAREFFSSRKACFSVWCG